MKMSKVIFGEPLIHLSSVDSTNIFANRLITQEEVQEGTVILADHQINGKGQGGNRWLSEPGSNLLFSAVFNPDFLRADRQYYLSMVVANAIADFLSDFSNNIAIKWPNDILISHKKIAGILIENTILGEYLRTTIAGIGLNVNQVKFPEEIPDAVSLTMTTGRQYKLNELLGPLLEKLSASVNLLYENRIGLIRTTYLNNLYGLNEWHDFSDPLGQFEGRITDVAESGELMVLKRNGELCNYGFREITFHRNTTMP
jgi:BirA family biotin operon repressor/biotin-[acetyl-CoA-carboxylase] ligase